MAIPKLLRDSTGMWKGPSKLHQEWEKEVSKQVVTSNSSLHIEHDSHATFATLTYTWEYNGKKQEGTLLICGDKAGDHVSGGWSDSWHQNTAVMQLVGTGKNGNPVNLVGSYEVPGSKPWGWRLTITLVQNEIVLKMFNIDPDGKNESWAVEAHYRKDES